MTDRTGQRFGNYRIIRPLGAGGFAEVYLGEHILLGRPAAIKFLNGRMNENQVRTFLREGQTIAALDHPNIIHILDFGFEEGTCFLVMEYASHGTLRQQHPHGSVLPITTIISYVHQIADALQYAHDHKIIHRDVKPENMLIRGDGRILLSDFGIAILASSTLSQSSLETVAGTVRYMAPEQFQGKPRPASDQYALGIVVYEWLCGKPPFIGSFTEVASQHVSAPPPPLHSKAPHISEEVEEVVMRALAKDPKDRFPTIRAFAQALEEAGVSTMQSSFSGTAPQENPGSSKSIQFRRIPLPLGQIPLPQSIPPLPDISHYDFFISYHQTDRDMATWIADCLQQAGHSVFPLRTSRIHLAFESEMRKAFIQATRIIVILSPAYIYALKSQITDFSDFKRATVDKQNLLFSVCVDGSEAIRKELSEIANYVDLTGKSDTRAEALLLAYVSGDIMKLPGPDVSQNRRDRHSASNTATTQLGPKDRNNLLFRLNSAQASEQISTSPTQLGSPNTSARENQETLGSIKLPPEQTLAPVGPASPNIPQDEFFISYNKADRDTALWIANFVQQAGYSVHFPFKDFGMNFVFINEMNKAFHKAKRMIVILSPNYIKALKSRRGGFNNFKRATRQKQNMLFSICVNSSTSIRRELSEIENHLDLTEESDTMIEELLHAYISGKSLNLSASGISLKSLNLSALGASPVLSQQQNSSSPAPPPTKKHVVLLVHGIRTHGAWQEMVKKIFETQNSMQVIPLRYGYFDALRFWFPFLTRKQVIERVLREYRATRMVYPDAYISIIAHSFGTYTIAKILEDHPDIRIYRLILCGSVLNTNLRWDKLQSQIEGYQAGTNGVINECGTRDIWPILARISTWGYGLAGSFGFGASMVTDRYHDYQHGDYFSPQFVKKYWVPFIEQGVITPSNWGPEIPWWMSALSLLPLHYIIVLLIMLPIILVGWFIFHR